MTVHAAAGLRPLPVVLSPAPDELLSSWIARHAAFYGISPTGMLRHGLPAARSLHVVDRELTDTEASRLAFTFRCDVRAIRAMTHVGMTEEAKRRLISLEPIQACRACSDDCGSEKPRPLARWAWWAWRLTCPVCGSRLIAIAGDRPPELFEAYWPAGLGGERLLDAYAVRGNWTWMPPVALLRLLLVRRACTSVDFNQDIERGRLIELIIPGFDRAVSQHRIELPKGERLIVPLHARVPLLAALSIAYRRGPAILTELRDATLGHYRLRFDAIVAEGEANNRRRTLISQLLQT